MVVTIIHNGKPLLVPYLWIEIVTNHESRRVKKVEGADQEDRVLSWSRSGVGGRGVGRGGFHTILCWYPQAQVPGAKRTRGTRGQGGGWE